MTSSDDLRISALEAELREFHAARSLRKCESDPSDLDAICEHRAAAMYDRAVEASGGVRSTARCNQCAPKTVRDRRDNKRGIYLKEALKFPPEGLIAIAEELTFIAKHGGIRREGTHD